MGRTAYETCPVCRGAGLQDGLYGPKTCYTCRGDCVIRIRDQKGRFSTKPEILYDAGEAPGGEG